MLDLLLQATGLQALLEHKTAKEIDEAGKRAVENTNRQIREYLKEKENKTS